MTTSLLDLGEALAKVLEPWADSPGPRTTRGVRGVLAASGVTVDLNMVRPTKWDEHRLYAWPTAHNHPLADTGNPPGEREDFGFQFVYTADRKAEEPQNQARRDVSDVLDAKGHAYSEAVARNRSRYANGSAAPWDDLRTSIDHNTTVTFGVRGIGVAIVGYRHITYA